jgi:hypothetical protein
VSTRREAGGGFNMSRDNTGRVSLFDAMTHKDEEWRDIAGYEKFYQVSNYGRVRSRRGNINDPFRLMCLLVPPSGYLTVRLNDRTVPDNRRVHRLVAESFLGPCPEGMVVDHIDRNRLNCHVSNLRYVTAKENANNRGDNQPSRPRTGEKRPMRLNAFEIAELKESIWRREYTVDELAEKYRMTPAQLHRILDRGVPARTYRSDKHGRKPPRE